MIELATENLAGIECIHAAPAGQRQARLPTILFYHGFTSSKEVYSYFAVALAQAGFRVVMPDADMHGARYNGDTEARMTHFWEILKQNIDEVSLLEAALREKDWIADERFAVAGASMGGMTALGAMVRYPQIHSVACMMGSGYFMQLSHTLFPPLVARTPEQKETFAARLAPLAPYDPSQQLDKLANRPLLLWHGEADEVVPFAETVRLEKALREAALNEKMTYLSEKQIGHKITPSALTALVSFFKHQL
ncbi:esterase [Type-E symbiont of Plautia stali]|uniref:Peptidase S9 prolyl oligopeptidase catalytic domain-containing protein n=1 Tax=Acyrthosiphon pisum TaxID=7029 RepID=A0A8R2D7E9_ACYPI|nr:esterase [Type-E symbiont of Plautia stali]|eukprot:XP_016664446.1 PREDICTED: esterase YjfP-like [Acyrthosiphon pisum]